MVFVRMLTFFIHLLVNAVNTLLLGLKLNGVSYATVVEAHARAGQLGKASHP